MQTAESPPAEGHVNMSQQGVAGRVTLPQFYIEAKDTMLTNSILFERAQEIYFDTTREPDALLAPGHSCPMGEVAVLCHDAFAMPFVHVDVLQQGVLHSNTLHFCKNGNLQKVLALNDIKADKKIALDYNRMSVAQQGVVGLVTLSQFYIEAMDTV